MQADVYLEIYIPGTDRTATFSLREGLLYTLKLPENDPQIERVMDQETLGTAQHVALRRGWEVIAERPDGSFTQLV